MNYIQQGSSIVVSDLCCFDAAQSFGCGQSFRFVRRDQDWEGVAADRYLHLRHQGDSLVLYHTDLAAFEGFWLHYFDLDRDYDAVAHRMAAYPPLKQAVAFSPGIRVFNQDGWEALCTFIISQNNHIRRIGGIVDRLCSHFGRPLANGWHAFPTPEALAALTVEDLAPLRAGFRAKYILDAARKVASGEVDLAAIPAMDTAAATAELCKIVGVGVKVASCALLFGFGKTECVPVDVWIGRAMKRFFPQGFPHELHDIAGIVQQYLFQYVRLCPEILT